MSYAGLRAAGRDLGGIVQTIEDSSQEFMIAVQWHPEFLLYLRKQRALFRELVACAQRQAADVQ